MRELASRHHIRKSSKAIKPGRSKSYHGIAIPEEASMEGGRTHFYSGNGLTNWVCFSNCGSLLQKGILHGESQTQSGQGKGGELIGRGINTDEDNPTTKKKGGRGYRFCRSCTR